MTIISSIPYPDFIDGVTTASGAQVNANNSSLITQINANAAQNGANTDITSLSNLTAPPSGKGSISFVAAVATTSNNNDLVVASTNPTGFSLLNGNKVTFLAPGPNTGAMTLNVNGTGALPMVKQINGAIDAFAGGEFILNQVIEAYYDSTANEYRVISIPPTPQQYFPQPTYQVFSGAGTSTYTTPSGCTRLKLRMIGAGGGGAGNGVVTASPTSGGATSFGSIAVNGGNPGVQNSGANGGAGGASSGNNASGGKYFAQQGAAGAPGGGAWSGNTSYVSVPGPSGASSPFGGGGFGSTNTSGPGDATSPGAGGGGSAVSFLNEIGGGGAGGAGEYAEAVINGPASSYTVVVGAGGTAGTGTYNGSKGGPGLVLVEEFYEVA